MVLTIELGFGLLLTVLGLWLLYRQSKFSKRLDDQGSELIEVQKVIISLHREIERIK